MSRVDKRIEANSKKKSYKKFFRLTFIILMICIMSACIFEIDKNAVLMFGEVKHYNIEVFISNIEDSIMKSLDDVYEKINNINCLRKN